MSAKVLQINKLETNETGDKTRRTYLKRALVATGLMKNSDEPHINGTAVILAIAFFALLIYVVIGAGVGRLDEKDAERGKQAILYNTAQKINARASAEQLKRARLLEYTKEKGIYNEVPEDLKLFESDALDRQNLDSNK